MITAAAFTTAAVACVGGIVMLLLARPRLSSRSRRRRRWARERKWSFEAVDPGLPARWRWGVVHEYGPGWARDLVTGAVPGPGGRRLGHVFDHEHDGHTTGCVVAVRGIRTAPTPVELRSVDPPAGVAGLRRSGAVAGRVVFTAGEGPAPISDDLATALADVGPDVPVVWLEDVWVLAVAEVGAEPERLERLLVALGMISAVLDAGPPSDGSGVADPAGSDLESVAAT